MKKTLFISAALLLFAAFVVGTLVYKAEKTEEAEQRASELQFALAREHSPRLGSPQARVEIVEVLDPACETCRRFYPLVKELMAAHPDRIRLVLRYTPFHQGADQVVALLYAAERQGRHREALEALLAAQDDWVAHHVAQPERVWAHLEGLGLDLERLRLDMRDPRIAAQIAQDLEDARALDVTRTPEFFVNGRPMPSFGYEQLMGLVDEALAGAYP
ncbi:MAG: DsbA family protein [Thiobacillaceae bacterium]|nr:DsbA family protein [Thiobacillaceae bacterium]